MGNLQKVVVLNLCIRVVCLLSVSLIATHAVSQDLSGWSDKTVCRLASSQQDDPQYLQEAKVRGLACGGSSSSETLKVVDGVDEISPLWELKVPENWVAFENMAAILPERERLKKMYETLIRAPESTQGCVDTMVDFNNELDYEIINKKAYSKARFDRDIIIAAGGVTDGSPRTYLSDCTIVVESMGAQLGYTPSAYEHILLKWASSDVMTRTTNKNDKSYDHRVYNHVRYISHYATHYAMFYDEYYYTHEERQLVEGFIKRSLMSIDVRQESSRGRSICNKNSISATHTGLANDTMSSNGCGTPMWNAMMAHLVFGLKSGDQAVFDRGLVYLDWMLHFFDEEGFFIPYISSKGAYALSYSKDVAIYMSVAVESLASIGYDLLTHPMPNGGTVKVIYDSLAKTIDNHLLYLKYNDDFKGAYGGYSFGLSVDDFRRWTNQEAKIWSTVSYVYLARSSARYINRYRPDLVKYVSPTPVDMDEDGNPFNPYYLVDPYLLFLANKHKENSAASEVWQGNNNEVRPIKSYVRIKKRLLPVFERFLEAHSTLRLDDIISGYKLGENSTLAQYYSAQWYLINSGPSGGEADYLGSDVLRVDESNNVYLEATDTSFLPSEDRRQALTGKVLSDGSFILTGLLNSGDRSSLYNTEIIGNLHSELAFGYFMHGDIFLLKLRPLQTRPESSAGMLQKKEYPHVAGPTQKRIAHLMSKVMNVDVSLEDVLNGKGNELVKNAISTKSDFFGSYQLSWYIVNTGPSGGYEVGATDYVTISEDGMTFEQVDQWKPPTPDLRKKLQFTMNDVGDFTLKGQLGLFDMSGKDYDTTIFGNIHQQVGLAIWEEGDPILVRITKQ